MQHNLFVCDNHSQCQMALQKIIGCVGSECTCDTCMEVIIMGKECDTADCRNVNQSVTSACNYVMILSKALDLFRLIVCGYRSSTLHQTRSLVAKLPSCTVHYWKH